jgi:hypothetical protein
MSEAMPTIRQILLEAISGTNQKYRSTTGEYIKWGVVERDIAVTVEALKQDRDRLAATLDEIRDAIFGDRAEANRHESLPNCVRQVVAQRNEARQDRDRLAAKLDHARDVLVMVGKFLAAWPMNTKAQFHRTFEAVQSWRIVAPDGATKPAIIAGQKCGLMTYRDGKTRYCERDAGHAGRHSSILCGQRIYWQQEGQ